MATSTIRAFTVALQMNNSKFMSGLGSSQKALKGFQSSIRAIGVAIGGGFAVGTIISFAKEASQLAAKAEGIERAFRALNKPGLLDELRMATKGTVSDMELMKNAVRANNFKIPLEQMGMFLAFAQKRAIETGESVEYLVESITNGIARKSLPILDNLGLSAAEVREEFNKTGDMAKAVANIIQRDMGNVADLPLTMAEKQAQFNAQIENSKVAFGGVVNQIKGKVLPTLTQYAEELNFILSSYEDLKRAAWDWTTADAVAAAKNDVKDLAKRLMESGVAANEHEAEQKALNLILEQYKNLLDDIRPNEEGRLQVTKTVIAELENLIIKKTTENKLSEKELELLRQRTIETKDLKQAIHDLAVETARGFKPKKTTKGQAPGFDYLENPDENMGSEPVDALIAAQNQAEQVKNTIVGIRNEIGQMLIGQVNQLGVALGEAFNGMTTSLKQLGVEIMNNIGNILIMAGLGVLETNPTLGAGLIVAGGIIQLGSGLVRGLGNKDSGTATAYDAGGNVNFRIQGKDLVGSLSRYNISNAQNT